MIKQRGRDSKLTIPEWNCDEKDDTLGWNSQSKLFEKDDTTGWLFSNGIVMKKKQIPGFI